MSKIKPVHLIILPALACALLVSNISYSQIAKQKIKYSTLNQGGLLTGEKGEALAVQTINGIKKEKFFAGIGVGLDFYDKRTVPLFIDVRRDFSSGRNTPFIYADAGVNFLWLNFIQREQLGFPKTSPGFYYDIGAGWKLSGKHQRGLIISAGYAFKQAKYKLPSYSVSPVPQLQEDNYDRYSLLFRRVVVKIGFQL